MKKSGKGRKSLKLILLILGISLLLWYCAPFAAGIFNIGNALGIAASTILIISGCFFDKMPFALRSIIISLICIVLAVAVPLTFNMAKFADYKSNDYDTVIVLGCKVNGSSPSRYLYDRCAAAAAALEENPNAVAILSGGQGPDENISEAQCMENVLTELGIDKSRLYKEDKSTNTRENIEFSKKIIEENKLSRKILVVTNEFHEYRAKLICSDYGLTDFHSKSSRSSAYTFLTFYTRELLGLIKEIAL